VFPLMDITGLFAPNRRALAALVASREDFGVTSPSM